MTGWFRHETVWLGVRYIAHAEKFADGRPISEGERVGTIRKAEGRTAAEAGAGLENLL